MRKKLLGLVIASALLMQVLAGCGGMTKVNVDWASFVGTWSEEGIGWEYGGMVVDFNMWEGEGEGSMWIDIGVNLVQAAPASRYATFYCGEIEEDMPWPVFTSEFEDSWGNTGTITLTFGEDSIECVIGEDMEYDPTANWGMYPGTYTLVRNDDAWDDLDYTEEEYYQRYPEARPAPVYDTSKASGILASLGMTEEQFKGNCQRLFSGNFQIGSPDGTEAYYTDLVEYPQKYIEKYFVVDNLNGYDFTVTYKGMSNDGYIYYENVDDYDYSAVIYDFRDDPYSPNIVREEHIRPYVIFKGVRTINGSEWLVFWMISVDTQPYAELPRKEVEKPKKELTPEEKQAFLENPGKQSFDEVLEAYLQAVDNRDAQAIVDLLNPSFLTRLYEKCSFLPNEERLVLLLQKELDWYKEPRPKIGTISEEPMDGDFPIQLDSACGNSVDQVEAATKVSFYWSSRLDIFYFVKIGGGWYLGEIDYGNLNLFINYG